MSKPAASTGTAFGFCVSMLVFISGAALVLAPAAHTGAASATSPAALSLSGWLESNPGATQRGAATPAARGRIQTSYAALPLAFEQNQGQTDSQVKYMARGNGYTLFLTANDAVFSLDSTSPSSRRFAVNRQAIHAKISSQKRDARKPSTAVVRMQLLGGNSLAKVAPREELPGTANYFLGNDPGKWRSSVPRYARVTYQDVYPGVNLAFHGAQRQLEFDFLVAPGADPQPIGFHFTGAQDMKTDDSGNLVVSSAAGDVLLHKPVAYQEQDGARQAVDVRFVLKTDNQVSFELGNYDRSRELVIDPSVTYVYSTYLGGSGEDDGFGIAFDSSGNAYVTGETNSTTFPQANPAKYNGGFDAFVTKIAADGSSLIYSTYVGGTGNDSGNGIAVDSNNNVFVGGGTSSTDFPGTTTTGAFQAAIKGSQNAFIFKLDSVGTLTYSTYLGGTSSDTALALALDSSGDVYVAGKASSVDFPLSKNPLQSTPAGGFVAKLTPAGKGASDLVFSTYVGHGGSDFASGVALDSSANAYITGFTSGSLTTTATAFQKTFGGGGSDAFVMAMKADGSALIYSTYLGGSDSDVGDGIAVDASGHAYVTGETFSSNVSTKAFPTTAGAFQTTFAGTAAAFITKLSPDGSTLSYSSYLGGSLANLGASIAVDGGGNAYVTGSTTSLSDFPTINPTQATFGGGLSDAFVSEANAAGSALVFSTFLGGSGDEDSTGNFGGIAVDSPGANIYVTGNTSSSDFPRNSAEQSTYAGGIDAFVAKYSQPAFSIAATTPTAVSPGTSSTSTVTLTALHGYNSPVNLTCTVTGTGSPLPACPTFATNPVTPTPTGASTTVTITTTGPVAAIFGPSKVYYAMWLPIAGLSLVGIGFSSSRSRRKSLFGLMMIGMSVAALILMPACGSSSSHGGGGCASVPSAPTGLAASSTTATGTTLNWTAAAVGANCSVTGYTVYQDGKAIGTPSGTTFAVTGLTSGTTYSFTVAASDSVGLSAQSAAVAVTTATPAGSYTVTITGKDASNRSQSTQVTLIVN